MRMSAGSSSRYAAILSFKRTVVYAITTRIQIKKTEYDIFFRIVKEQPTHSTRNDPQATSMNSLADRPWGSATGTGARQWWR